MSMDTSSCASTIASFADNFRNGDTTSATWNEVLDHMAITLDNEFQKALPEMLSVDITTPAGSLSFTGGEPSTNASMIATAVTAYWVNTIEPTGEPQNCDGIDNVINTASTILPIIESGLLAIANDSYIDPPYEKFVSVILDAVKTIIWTVSESSTLCSSEYPVTVS